MIDITVLSSYAGMGPHDGFASVRKCKWWRGGCYVAVWLAVGDNLDFLIFRRSAFENQNFRERKGTARLNEV